MKVLVTGANGQVGWELQNQSCCYNFDLYALDHKSLDITDTKAISEQVMRYQPEIIINTAGYTSVDLAEQEDSVAHAVNCSGPRRLAEICKETSTMLIHLSTDYVFNGFQDEPYIEEDTTDPVNVYGITKLEGENKIRSILDDHIILRTSWVFGNHGNNFIKTIINLAKEKKEIKVIDDQYGCPTSAKSVAKSILDLTRSYFTQKRFQFGTYHYTGLPITTWYTFAKEGLNIALRENLIPEIPLIKPVSSEEYKTLSRRPINSSLSSKKIQNTFGIKPSDWISDLEYMIAHLN